MENTLEELRGDLLEFDGRAISLLSEAASRYSSRENYLDCLVKLSGMAENNVSNGATWLIKSHLDAGGGLSINQTSHFLSQLNEVQDWGTKLHICQCVQHLIIPASSASDLVNWLGLLLNSRRPFLRAWSVDALFRLSIQHPEYSITSKNALSSAIDDPAASVRARVRNLKK